MLIDIDSHTIQLILIILIGVQLVTINILTPLRWHRQHQEISKQYPRDNYSRFYIFSVKEDKKHTTIRKLLDTLAIIVILSALYIFFKRDMSAILIWALLSFLQLIPSIYSLIILNHAQLRRRKMPLHKPREIDFSPRHPLQFIPALYTLMLVVAVLISFVILWQSSNLLLEKKLMLSCLFLLTLFLLSYRIYTALYGKVSDKNLTLTDRENKRAKDIERATLGIVATAILFSLISTLSASGLNQVIVMVLFSLFIQMAIYQRTNRWIAQRMNVYKDKS